MEASVPFDDLENFGKVIECTMQNDTEKVTMATKILDAMGKEPRRFVDTVYKLIQVEVDNGKTNALQ